ncbi:Clavaminate synthase-like protein [Thelephora ganbajun]|uniref:Clavaminate synthase-like protein n=1 Tax=Thelephora ganbajun TaxID=370292 RepID=A0ACB6ZJC3_THEGA|nr:Clavaminate synthase-like protein [Thelephora ganbajun]
MTREAFSQIPVIDLNNIRSLDTTARGALAKEVKRACVDVGFFYVKNHGIPEETVEATMSASKRFFSLSEGEKLKLDIRKSMSFKGYQPLLSSNNDPENMGDMHEGYEVGWEELDKKPDDSKRSNDGTMAGANVWPDELPGFREAILKYYHAAVGVGRLLFPLFALALDLPEDFFDDKTKNSAAIMKVLHYPAQSGPVDDRIIGIGAHTDFECFTVLWQEPGIQALQVLNQDKKWIDAPPIPGTLVMNIGDQFARWTNDAFKSTVHRAINRSSIERYSMPLFFGTDYDVKLVPIPSCVSEDRPAKYPVVTAGDYVKDRLKAAYGHHHDKRES